MPTSSPAASAPAASALGKAQQAQWAKQLLGQRHVCSSCCDVEDGLRSQRPTQLAQCPPKAHDVMAAAVGEAVLAAAAMVAAAEAAQQE
ncbi:hypothetical protein QJQ45_021021 [Haematococcus lacustris]|nr:hypothetical protein QJQ45_021021 [Haematococcus lacustris]